MKSQCEIALEALKAAGQRGVHSFDLNKIIGTNYSPRRIYDLKKKGYAIDVKNERVGNAEGVRYFLHQKKKPEYKFDKERQVFYVG